MKWRENSEQETVRRLGDSQRSVPSSKNPKDQNPFQSSRFTDLKQLVEIEENSGAIRVQREYFPEKDAQSNAIQGIPLIAKNPKSNIEKDTSISIGRGIRPQVASCDVNSENVVAAAQESIQANFLGASRTDGPKPSQKIDKRTLSYLNALRLRNGKIFATVHSNLKIYDVRDLNCKIDVETKVISKTSSKSCLKSEKN